MFDASSEVMQHRPSEETGPVTTTVDHADIRGLVTTLLVSVGCLPRSRHEDLSQPHNVHEGCTYHRGCVSSEDRCRSLSPLIHGGYADTVCVLAIAHMKAASSRATAAAMVFGCLPRASNLRYRPQRR